MGCGASAPAAAGGSPQGGRTSSSYKSEDNTQRESVRDGGGGGGSRGYWERQKLVASKWTVNSTMSIAKAAMENGMPEPPQSYFETQDRLVRFFEEHGELKIFEPNEVVIEMGADLEELYIVEEGGLIAEKDVVVIARSAKKPEGGGNLKDKSQEKRAYKKANPKQHGEEGDGSVRAGEDDAEQEEEERGASFKEAAEAEAFLQANDSAAERESAVYEEALRTAVSEHKQPPKEVIRLSTLEQHEMVGDVPLIEGSAVEMRYRADPSEGAALRVLPREKLVAEMHRDPIFAGNVFRNIAITLSVKCEEICWRLEDMAVEASSMAWRTGMNKRHKQKYAVAPKEAKRLQELLGVPEEEKLHHSTTASFEHTMRVHGSLLVFSESLCFYARVFGMVVKKVLHIDSIVAVLRDTPAIADVRSAIEVALTEETLIFSEIPDLAYTCEALNEVLALWGSCPNPGPNPGPNPNEVLTLRGQRLALALALALAPTLAPTLPSTRCSH